jgi:hypothetical protein
MPEKLLPVVTQPNQMSLTRTPTAAHQNVGSKTLQVCGIKLHSWYTLSKLGEQFLFPPYPVEHPFAIGPFQQVATPRNSLKFNGHRRQNPQSPA